MLLFGVPAEADTITLAGDYWCPYSCNTQVAKPGYAIEMARTIFEEAGHKVEYIMLPWSRSLSAGREGKITAIIGAMKSDAPDFIYPEEQLGVLDNSFFVLKDSSWTYTNTQSLAQAKKGIAVITDYTYGENLDTFLGKHAQLVQRTTGERPLEKNIR